MGMRPSTRDLEAEMDAATSAAAATTEAIDTPEVELRVTHKDNMKPEFIPSRGMRFKSEEQAKGFFLRLELFDHQKFDGWVERGEALAIPSSLKLYNEVCELGFRTFVLTGRSEGHLDVTAENLKKQGFHDWDKLILRAADDRKKTATVYKSEKGKVMEEEGYRIIGNSGDQWSKLLGWYMSTCSFNLPNPMYYPLTETEKQGG